MSSQSHIVFGTGPLGLSVIHELTGRGEKVRAVNRKGKAPVSASVEVCAGDVSDIEQVRPLVQGKDVIYFCVNAPYHQWTELFPPMQKAILQAAIEVGAKLVVAENVYMYGDTNGKPITEDTPLNAHTKKGSLRARMSEDLMEAHAKGHVRVSIGRASDYYGPGVTESAFGDRVFWPLLEGKGAQLTGNIDVPHSLTYIQDFGRLLVALGERNDALGQVWHAPNAPALSQRQMVMIAAEKAGVAPKMSTIGTMMMRIAGLFIPGARETVEMMYEFNKPFIVEGYKAERAFELAATPLEEGLRKTVEWYAKTPRPANH